MLLLIRLAPLPGSTRSPVVITYLDVYLGETVLFGAREITLWACYNHPITETRRTSAFLEIDQCSLTGTAKRISPAGCSLTAEH